MSSLVLINLLLILSGPFVVVGAVTGVAALGWPDLLGRLWPAGVGRSRSSRATPTGLAGWLAFG